jgi:hypothetical protein
MHSFDDDKELDLLSKTAAEAIDAPSSANWEMLQRALDKELPLQKKRRGTIIWWFLPALLVAGLGYFWFNPSPNSTINVQPSKETKQNNSISKTPTTVELNKSSDITSNETTDHDKTIAIKQGTNFNQSKISKKEENKIIVQDSPKGIHESFVTKEITTSEKSNNGPVVKEEVTPKDQAILNDTKSDTIESKSIEKNSPNPINNSKNIVISKKELNKNKGFFIGLIGGFDASTVKFKYASNVGYNIGGTIGYRFDKHWSLQSGAIYTQKNYKINGQDFHAPKGSWISYYEIETVEGYCKMWDVPIIATYHFTGNNNGNTFLSIGTSSYFMKHENYNYLYDYNNQYYNRLSSINSSDKHLFALLHISAGIERPISKSITSIIEPYAKIPLAGVGFGSIQLSSFGLNFSVQYRQPKK